MARTSSLNCLSCRSPYQTPHSLNASPLFTEKPFFSLKSAVSHPLPKNWILSEQNRYIVSCRVGVSCRVCGCPKNLFGTLDQKAWEDFLERFWGTSGPKGPETHVRGCSDRKPRRTSCNLLLCEGVESP